MTGSTFEKYGLVSNPFRDLSSESLDDVEIYHVNLQVDDTLRTIKDETFEKENRAVVAITGGHGAGKTERLLLAAAEARQRQAFSVYVDITTKTNWVLKGLADAVIDAAKTSGRVKTFSSPKWLRDVSALQGIKDQGYDPIKAGKAVAAALNESAPSMLLLNDLHHLTQHTELDAFLRTLQEIGDAIRPGVLVMFGCYPNYLEAVMKSRPAFASRINRTMQLPVLSVEEAGLLLAKKMLARRLVEDLDPLFPFDRESVAYLNEYSNGNPRRLLESADLAIEYAAERRAYRVDIEVARAAVANRPRPLPASATSAAAVPPPSGSAAPAPSVGALAPNRIPPAGTAHSSGPS